MYPMEITKTDDVKYYEDEIVELRREVEQHKNELIRITNYINQQIKGLEENIKDIEEGIQEWKSEKKDTPKTTPTGHEFKIGDYVRVRTAAELKQHIQNLEKEKGNDYVIRSKDTVYVCGIALTKEHITACGKIYKVTDLFGDGQYVELNCKKNAVDQPDYFLPEWLVKVGPAVITPIPKKTDSTETTSKDILNSTNKKLTKCTAVSPSQMNIGEWGHFQHYVVVKCPSCGQIGSLNAKVHNISPEGVVRPSILCTNKKCNEHYFATLEGWSL